MKDITIYTSSTCGYCHEAKTYLDKNDIPYTEKNISEDKDARKELMSKGYMGVPVIVVGDQTLQGFDKKKLEEAIQA